MQKKFELFIQSLFHKKNLFEFSNYSSNFSFIKKIWIIHSIFISWKKFTWIFLIWSNYSFNFTSKKKFQIITLGKMFNYSFEFYFAKNSFNIFWKKIYSNFLIKKNIQLLIQILFRKKFIQYTSEKNLFEFYFTKKYSDYSLVLWCHILCETFY